MTDLEKQLNDYRAGQENAAAREEKVLQTLRASKRVFYEAEEKKTSSYFEFLWEQAAYIRKYWWLLQFCVLALLWAALYSMGQNPLIQRNMGTFASLFVIIMIPEFWKNKNHGAMEIEGAAFYSLRQIYAARMTIFAMADILLLSLFCFTVQATTQMTIMEMLIQFFLPFNVNCCICCRILCGKRICSETSAVGFSVIWAAVWYFVICNENIFNAVSEPVWIVSLILSVVYFGFSVCKVLNGWKAYWEVSTSWN